MANLPQRPLECDDRRQRYSPDDRHYPATISRIAPMRYRRDDRDRDPRSRPEGDVYVPPPRGYSNSYVPPGYDRHEDERHRSYRHESDYRREDDYRREGDLRQRYDNDRNHSEPRPWDTDREHYGRVDRRWERDTWVPSEYDRDRRQVYERDKDRDHDRERERDRDRGIGRGGGTERPLSPRRDPPRPRRDTRSPPRRTGPHGYFDSPPGTRRPSVSPRRPSQYQRHRSPSYTHGRPHSRSHSTTRSNSRPATPSSKRIRLGNHSISNSPRSPARSHEHPPHASPFDSQRRHSPPRRTSRSRSPEREKDKPQRDVGSQQLSSTPPIKERPADSPTLKQNTPTPLRSPRPVKPEPTEHAQPPPEQQPQDKGKLKEQPPTNNEDTDVKMRDRSASPPRHSRGAPPSGPAVPTPRSPPRAPRNYPKTPTAPASFYHHNASASHWPRRNTTMPMASPMSVSAEVEANPVSEPEPPVAIATLPMIPVYQTKPSITPELDKEIARIQAHRAHLVSDYAQVAKATRRALHELDIATIDLRAAENRRKLADSQVEKARAGVLGINAMQVS